LKKKCKFYILATTLRSCEKVQSSKREINRLLFLSEYLFAALEVGTLKLLTNSEVPEKKAYDWER